MQTELKKKNPAPNEALDKAIIPQPEQELQVNDYNIDAFLEKRAEFITKVNKIMVEGKDYHVIQGKKSLAKGGAEKIASIFGWTARFSKDEEVSGAFSEVKGLISFVCDLEKVEKSVGQGRGAAILSKNGGDPNKTIKMAQKSAFIDAVLRASGLSDFFTQDLEDMPKEQISQSPTYNPKAQTPDAEYFCDTHDLPLVMQPAGKTAQGKPYKAFWKCTEKPKYGVGKWCRGPFVNTDGQVVKQNPETGEMEVERAIITGEPLGDAAKQALDDAEIVETSVEKARRIMNAIPYKANHEGD